MTQRLGANGPVFDADGMTPDEAADGFIRHSAARAAARMMREEAAKADRADPLHLLRQPLRDIEDALGDLGNLIAAERVVAEVLTGVPGDRLLPFEVEARDGLIGVQEAIKSKLAEVDAAFDAVWRAAHAAEKAAEELA